MLDSQTKEISAELASASAVYQRRITVLGSTGSVGRNTLDLVARCRASQKNSFDILPIEALTAYHNVDLLIEQALTFRPKMAVIGDESLFESLKAGLEGTGIAVAAGKKALIAAADMPADWVMAAIVGAAGLPPTAKAAERGAMVALANKECLVCSGPIFLDLVKHNDGILLPVDSEHNAIFQVFESQHPQTVEKLILTASGGPFRTWTAEAMSRATPEQAIAHPNWSMGAKISVDSATMMNKGLELIEASYLFDIEEDRIEILIHPQSVVHSMVKYVDGSVLAQMGTPDMRIPIASALAWPERISTPAPRLDLAEVAELTFESPDIGRFPALELARQCLQTGGGMPTILNAANEIAVRGFLDRKIGFLDIAAVVERTLEEVGRKEGSLQLTDLDGVSQLDEMARTEAEFCMNKLA